jgi:hypothetical protein
MVFKGLFGCFHEHGKWDLLGEYDTTPYYSVVITIRHLKKYLRREWNESTAEIWKVSDKSGICFISVQVKVGWDDGFRVSL